MSSKFPAKVCLYAKVTPEPSFEYQIPIKDQVLTQLPDFYWYDFDNFSEGMIIDYVIQMVQQAKNIVLIVNAKPNSALGGLLKLIPQLHRQKAKVKAVFQGEHAQLQKVLKPLGQLCFNPSDAELQAFITD